ncbi:hypothetical protein Q0Z83_073330 [Actinoplanes sichuanensis]|nr:hypothetical protein Q0Z83_073330 [Actinoplanes sichuanensis]
MQLEETADHLHVPDPRDVEEAARRLAEQGGDHGLGYEILGATDPDLSLQRRTAVHDEDIVGQRNLQPVGARTPGVEKQSAGGGTRFCNRGSIALSDNHGIRRER